MLLPNNASLCLFIVGGGDDGNGDGVYQNKSKLFHPGRYSALTHTGRGVAVALESFDFSRKVSR